MSDPEIGATAAADLYVRRTDLASAVRFEPGDAFPPVFATARMVALMEVAAARILAPHLAPGEFSVGVSIEAAHTAATPGGAAVRAEARYLGREGKAHLFEVIVSDAGGEVGRATHRRAVVSGERLVAGAAKRVPDARASTPPLPELGLTNARGNALSRVALLTRELAATLSGWRLSIVADEGEGGITRVDTEEGAAIHRGDGVCLGWTDERLAAAYEALRPRDDTPAPEFMQLG
jgi:fluoroacetyl-CoA thioesterase